MAEERKSYWGRAISVVVILAVLGVLVYGFYWYFSRTRCMIPVKFAISSVDSRFKIDKSGVTEAANEAANEWNSQAGLNLFSFDPSAPLKINMIYDSRQGEIDNIKGQASSLENQKSSLDTQNAEFEALLSQYKDRLNKYNSEVAYFNANGGAPPDEYVKLNQEQQDLKKMQQTLSEMASSLNRQGELYNAKVGTLQQDISQNASKIITQGEFDPNSDTINIYTYGGSDELRFVLMHELGHALGLDHVSDPKALMYTMVQQQDVGNPTLTQADLTEIERVCNFEKEFRFPSWQDLKNLFLTRAKKT